MTYEQFINFLYYKCLPTEWVKEDMGINPVAPFYRYLQALVGYDFIQTHTDSNGVIQREIIAHQASGFETVINATNIFNTLVNPNNCPNEVFPYLFNSFGLNYNSSIENKVDNENNSIIYYQRKLLNNIGLLLERRGTISGIRYLIRILTGLEFTYEYERITDSNGKTTERRLTIHLLLSDVDDEINKEHSRKVIEQFLGEFTPHYITVVLGESKLYSTSDISTYGVFGTNTYTLNYDKVPLKKD